MKPATPNQQSPTFTDPELRALLTLRVRYRQIHHLFTGHELARMRFLRWLMLTGRLAA